MIHLLATGGTIAGETDPAAGHGRYRAGARPVAALIAAVPGLADAGPIAARQILALDSKDMTPADWLKILAATRAALHDPTCEGVVILHGTDTLEETAWFLHLTLPAGKPVVLTGAMRPADHPQADGPANLLAAVRLAASPEACGRGVLVVMNGTAFGARRVVKARCSGLDAFESTEPWQAAHADGSFTGLEVAALPRVDILPGYAGAPADLIDASVAAGARGLVLALCGNGSVPAAWLPALRAAHRHGVAIVRGSRASGCVAPDANADDSGEGWLTAADLPPPKARITLMLGLAAGLSGEALRRALLTCGS